MFRLLGKLILKLWGWKIEGDDPGNRYKKLIYVVMPHTSNWDFLLGISTKWLLRMNIKWLGKNTLFRWPYGWLFRALDGIPVVRNKNLKLVDNIVETFNQQEELRIVIPVEGTRGPVNKIKTGFFYIAKNADVPISFMKIRADKKTLEFSDVIEMTGDLEKDMAIVDNYFRDGVGIIPENGYNWTSSSDAKGSGRRLSAKATAAKKRK